jgi:hypothetical protein
MITWGETDELCDTRHGHSGCGHGGILSGSLCVVKHYTRPINRFRQAIRDLWEDIHLWYLNTPIPLYWNFHVYRWWIRLGVFAFVVVIIWAV